MSKTLAKLDPRESSALSVLANFRRELETTSSLAGVKELRDKAEAVRQFCKTAAMGLSAMNAAAECKLLAERKAGAMLAGIEKHNGDPRLHDATRLSDLGIEKTQSHRWQRIASVPEDRFNSHVATIKQQKKELTTAGVLRLASEPQREEQKAKLDAIRLKQVSNTLTKLYDVIVIDPPWPMEKIEREVRPNQVAFDYPTMQEDELIALPVPAKSDCHVWVWATHRFLPMAFRLIESWNFKYVCSFVWHKPGGFQPVGLPQYNCEFVLYARNGSPTFTTTKAFNLCFSAPRTKHSEKPEEFYRIVRTVTSGDRLDMFNRRPIRGFEGWGKEAMDEAMISLD